MAARGHGRIVNMASVTGPMVTFAGTAGYSTAKAGMVGLTRSIALEYGARGITCNAVLPGWIASESQTELEAKAGLVPRLAGPAPPTKLPPAPFSYPRTKRPMLPARCSSWMAAIQCRT